MSILATPLLWWSSGQMSSAQQKLHVIPAKRRRMCQHRTSAQRHDAPHTTRLHELYELRDLHDALEDQ